MGFPWVPFGFSDFSIPELAPLNPPNAPPPCVAPPPCAPRPYLLQPLDMNPSSSESICSIVNAHSSLMAVPLVFYLRPAMYLASPFLAFLYTLVSSSKLTPVRTSFMSWSNRLAS